MNAPMAPRRHPARREDAFPSVPVPNSSGLMFNSSSSPAPRSRFAALAEKRPDGYPSSSMGGGANIGAAATPHKVWLGSLPSTLKETELRERLACFGTIQSFFFKPEQVGAAVHSAEQHNKKARGWAFVSYTTAEEAQALIKAMDGKPPDAVFSLAGSSLAALGTAPPVEARLANASKTSNSSGSLSTNSVSDGRTGFSEEEPHSREKLLAMAFFTPSSHKPSAAPRSSSLAPFPAGMSAADNNCSSSSSIRCSSHPRITDSSSSSQAGGSVVRTSANTSTVVSNMSGELLKQTPSPLHDAAVLSPASSPSQSFLPTSTILPNQQAVGLSASAQLKQQFKLDEEEKALPPAPTCFPPPPAGSATFGLPHLANSGKPGGIFPSAEAAAQTKKQPETTAAPAAAEAAATSTAAAAGTSAAPPNTRADALAPCPVVGQPQLLPQQQQEPQQQDRQQQQEPQHQEPQQQQDQQAGDALNGSGGAGAGQRGKRVYGGLHAAAFPPLSAAAALGGSSSRQQPQQPGRPETPGLPALWEVYWTPDTQQPYYYNAVSKHVQWERPLPPREYVEQYGSPMTEELGPPAPLIPGITRGVVAGKGNAVVGPQGSNLFVFHLPPEWSEQTFLRHFAPFGNVVSCKIQINAQTGKRGGFGFVSYDNPASAIASIRMLNGFAACGKMLKVQLKKGEEHLLPPDLQQLQQQQQQHPQSVHSVPAPPVGFVPWNPAS